MHVVTGQLFFASTESFINYFKAQTISENAITIDFTNCKVWDDSAVGSLLKVKELLKAKDISVTYKGIDESSKQLMRKLTGNSIID